VGLVPVQFSSHAVNKSLHVAVARGRRCNTAFTAARVRGTIVSLRLQGTNIINIDEVRGRTANHGFSVVKKDRKGFCVARVTRTDAIRQWQEIASVTASARRDFVHGPWLLFLPIIERIICLQCFDTVGWASGRASGL